VLLLFAGLAKVLELVAGSGPIDPQALFERFLPPHDRVAGNDPFSAVEAMLGQITSAGKSLSVVAIPAFVWFSTRLFASVRTALNAIYDVSLRPPGGNFLVRYLLAKLRDLGMVLLTLVFFLANTLLTLGLSLLNAYLVNRGSGGDPVVSSLERWAATLLAFLLLILLFFLLYRHASLRRVRWEAALVASLFMAVAFEIAKQLYALYIRGSTGYGAAVLDASVGALILFVVWLYYSALVFLLGGVVAETWELRAMQRKQRGLG
jgi:membrane protein